MLGSKNVWMRIYLRRVESEMSMWEKVYETIAPRRLNQSLEGLQKALSLADEDVEATLIIQNIIDQLEGMQVSLPQNYQQAQKIVNAIRELRRERTRALQAVMEVDEVVGAFVVYPNNLTPIVGQVVRFCPANSERRFYQELGEVVLRPADEQVAMGNIFKEMYCYGSGDPLLSDLYYWPGDLPPQTFLEPGRTKDLLSIQWSRHQKKKISLKKNMARRMGGDKRIGMTAYYQHQEVRGELITIQNQADGSEIWTINSVERGQIRDESSYFWLEVKEFPNLFPPRTIDENAIAQTLLEALQLYRIQIFGPDEISVHAHHYASKEWQQKLGTLLKSLNGDIEDDQRKKAIQELYERFYQNLMHDIASREYQEAARTIAARIARLRRDNGSDWYCPLSLLRPIEQADH